MCEGRMKMTRCKTVLVTVGTTRFDALTRAVDSVEFIDILESKGYSKLIIQIGSSEHTPRLVCPGSQEEIDRGEYTSPHTGFRVEWFRYTPSLKIIISNCSLIISNAGAGSIFESLSAGIDLIAVPNADLMDNHQADLSSHLKREGYLDMATPETLIDVMKDFDGAKLRRYASDDGKGIASHIQSRCFETDKES